MNSRFKTIKKSALLCLVFAVLAGFLPVLPVFSGFMTASAEAVTADIFNNSDRANMVVTVRFDVEEPVFALIKPNGSQLLPNEYIEEKTDISVSRYIPNAASGQWKIQIDKGANSSVNVGWTPYARGIKITDLSFEPFEDEYDKRTTVIFSVEGDTSGNYDYKLYAVVLDSGSGIDASRLLREGRGTLNEYQSVDVDVSALATYDRYYFYLEVQRKDLGAWATDDMVSSSRFSVVRADANSKIKDVAATVNLSSNRISLDWSKYSVSCNNYVLRIFDADKDGEPLFSSTYESSDKTASMVWGAGVKRLRVELSYVRRGELSEILVKEIPLDCGVEFKMPSNRVINSQQISIEYNASRDVTINIEANGSSREHTVSGSGKLNIPSKDYENTIKMTIPYSEENVTYVYDYSVFVDLTPPDLSLPEHVSTIYTDKSEFNIAGVTEPDCTVTINGAVTSLKEDGTFMLTVSLNDGENRFDVCAADSAGNETRRTVIINRTSAGAALGDDTKNVSGGFNILDLLPMMIAAVCAIIIIILVIRYGKIYGKRAEKNKKYAVCSVIRDGAFILGGMTLAITVYLAVRYLSVKERVYSDELFSTVDESVDKAYDLIEECNFYESLLTLSAIITGVLLLAGVVCVILAKNALKPKKEKPPKPEKQPKQPKPAAPASPALPQYPGYSPEPQNMPNFPQAPQNSQNFPQNPPNMQGFVPNTSNFAPNQPETWVNPEIQQNIQQNVPNFPQETQNFAQNIQQNIPNFPQETQNFAQNIQQNIPNFPQEAQNFAQNVQQNVPNFPQEAQNFAQNVQQNVPNFPQETQNFAQNVQQNVQQNIPQPTVCPGCGATIAPGMNFCVKCGYRLM